MILFIIPSKYNLINKTQEPLSTPVEKQEELSSQAESKPLEEKIPMAKEEEVIIIEEAEEVKPLPPPAPVEKETILEKEPVTYKIKWGDTLWDIADTYYKNPWKYKTIASFNGIRNPDHIISGTVITIPEN